MLAVYEFFFSSLNKSGCRYFVYKGIEHLSLDLNEGRGDIDLIVHFEDYPIFEDVVRKSGFYKSCVHKGYPAFFISRDSKTGIPVMLDVDTCVRRDWKKPFAITISNSVWDGLDIQFFNRELEIPVLSGADLICLYAYYGKFKSLNLLQEQQVVCNDSFAMIKKSHIAKVLLKDHCSNEALWGAKQLLDPAKAKHIKQLFRSDFSFFSFHALRNSFLRLFVRIISIVNNEPAFRINKNGLIVAFVGVDGSGKSTLVEGLLEDSFFKRTGVKRIYFGGKEYKLSVLDDFIKKHPRLFLINLGFRYLLSLERQSRVLVALFWKYRGYVVLCDRYFYDDLIAQRRERLDLTGGLLRKIALNVKMLFKPKVLVRPDICYFLKVTPELAYSRKQEFSFSKMELVCKEYNEFLSCRDEVTVLDASLDAGRLRNDAVTGIINKWLGDF